MKLTRDEKRRVVGALTQAIAVSERHDMVATAWEYKLLRKKFEEAVKNEGYA